MKIVNFDEIVEKVADACIKANCILPDDVKEGIKKSVDIEESPLGKEILKQILENQRIAETEMIPACQDTGTAVIFLEIGDDVKINHGYIVDAINEGVRKGYMEGYLRKSIVEDPLRRKNTGDNTPAIIHTTLVKGDTLKITIVPKGGGSENMSEVKMMAPAAGREGIIQFVKEKVTKSKANPCPPIIVGVGIGGNFERSALLAKKALLRKIGKRHPDPYYAELEKDLFKAVNSTGIGPQGLGGKVTALDVFVEYEPCHIASMPVAVNLNCHVARHREIEF